MLYNDFFPQKAKQMLKQQSILFAIKYHFKAEENFYKLVAV